MKFIPRHPMLNFVAAMAITATGIFCVAFAFSEIKAPRFIWDDLGNFTSVTSAMFFGIIFIIHGGNAIYLLVKYFTFRHHEKRKSIQTESASGK